MNRDFLDMLCALNEAEAEFIVVGAHAVAAHGYPRATGDLDILVRPDPANACKVMDAIRHFGAPLHDLALEDLARENIVFQIGVVPVRIDLMTSITGVSFEQAWNGRMRIFLSGIEAACLGRDELIINKRATGRDKDLLDIKEISKNK